MSSVLVGSAAGIAGISVSEGGVATYTSTVLGLGPIAYWPMWEQSGTVAEELVQGWNGTYARDVSVMGTETGIGDGNTAPTFTAPNDYVDVYSAGLAGAFSMSAGSVMGWSRIAAAQWTDGVLRTVIQLGIDNSNYVRINKRSNVNELRPLYVAGATVESIVDTLSITIWFNWLLTWSKSADEVKTYINDVQFGSTQTGLGVPAGSLNSARCVIGAANNVGTAPFTGGICHVAVFDKVLVP